MKQVRLGVRWLGVLLSCAIATAAAGASGCGLDVSFGDLFVLTRTGPGPKLTMVVGYSGSIACNGAPSKSLPDPLLLRARDLQAALDKDAKAGLRIPRTRTSVYYYSVKLQDGTVSFPDTAGATHSELAQTEQFTLEAARQGCGLAQ